MNERTYEAITPEVEQITTTTPEFATVEVPEMDAKAYAAFLRYQEATKTDPKLDAKITKMIDKSESEEASAVRGKVMEVIDSAITAALASTLDSASESFIEGASEYIARVGKITTTTEIAPDGELQVVTKSPRRKQEATQSTANA